MLRVPNFVKNYTIGCANSQKKYTAGCANLQIKKLCCWVCYFYTQGFTLKNYLNCLRANAGLKLK